ncbi:MAG: hypothetical protein DRQ78_00175 [Epsilonproteobacteria bacterium]|nr:MAG: hypothetical protein DRQ78_00175 [Campylobacterota bacterium]
MRSEDIDFLIRSKIPVTKFNLDNIESSQASREAFSISMASSAINLNIQTFNDMSNYATTLFQSGIDKKVILRDQVDYIRKNTDGGIEDIVRGLTNLKEEASTSSVLESAMSGELKTLSISFDNDSTVSRDSEGVMVKEGVLYADTSKENSIKEAIRIEKYNFSSMSSFMRSKHATDIAKIELVSDSGVGYYPEPGLDVINSDIRFRLEGISDIDISRNIDLIVDRKDSSLFNQIEIDLSKAHMVSIYTSNDGEYYKSHTSNPRYIKSSTVQIEPVTDRYVKIVFDKLTHDMVRNGNNVYSVTVNSLSLLRTTFSGQSLLLTNPIKVSGSYSKIAMSVCDCISNNQQGKISYFLSVNGKEWESIRPVGRSMGDSIHRRSVLDVNPLVTNKFILLEEKEEENSIETYTLPLPEDFISSNYIRIFGNNITDSSEDWIYGRSMYYATGILYDEKVVDFGPDEILLNGTWVTGEQRLMPDIYKISIRADNYSNVILNRKNNIIDIGNGEYAVESDDGTVRTVFDPLYPYNHKYIIEKEFDYIFEQELIEKEDYNLYNKDSEYYLSTMESYDNIIIAYRLHESNVNSIQLKAELQSGDFVTIPYIEKIIIRLA